MAINSFKGSGLSNTNTLINPNANFSNTATGTYTDGNGISWKYVQFNSSGTLVVTQSGLADILVVGGGGGGLFPGNTGGMTGGGGGVRNHLATLPSGSLTITVGAGGAAGSNGVTSEIESVIKAGGGARGLGGFSNPWIGGWAGSDTGGGVGGGGLFITYTATGYGNSGTGSGGTIYGSSILSGITSSITNTAVEYGKSVAYDGGAGAGAANTGTGGGRGAAGGSGVVIVRVRTN